MRVNGGVASIEFRLDATLYHGLAMPERPPPAFLSGWKEIASYLGKGVRTTQRYEREQRLPIHRPNGKSTGSVMAAKSELNEWVLATRNRDASTSQRLLEQRSNQLGAEFLQLDSEIALTFSGLALAARNEEA